MGGMPFRGPTAPLLKRDELIDHVQIHRDFRHKKFDLSDSEQDKQFEHVMDRCINGWYKLYYIDRRWSEEKQNYIVYLEWSQQYGELAPTAPIEARSQNNEFSKF